MNEPLANQERSSDPEVKLPRRPLWLRMVRWGVLLVAVHLLLDGLHAAYIGWTYRQWEATAQRDASGVLAGCDSFTLVPSGELDRSTALLLVHGLGASPRHYDKVAERLASEGFYIRALRLPGFAEPLARYRQSTADQWVLAVKEELAALRAEHKRVGVVGHSLGGATTIGLLRTVTDAGETLPDFAVLLAPAVKVSDSRSPLLSTRQWHETSQRTFVFTDTLGTPFGMDVRDPTVKDHVGQTPFVPSEVVDQLFQLMDANLPAAERIDVPTTLVVAKGDVVIDTPAAKAFFARMPNESNELVELANSGHELPLDLQWEQVAEAIAKRAAPALADEQQ